MTELREEQYWRLSGGPHPLTIEVTGPDGKPVTNVKALTVQRGDPVLTLTVVDWLFDLKLTEDQVAVLVDEKSSQGTLVEILADLEHEQWSHWTKYMLDKLGEYFPEIENHSHVAAWRRQIATQYQELSESEKDSDREWAHKVIDVIRRLDSFTNAR